MRRPVLLKVSFLFAVGAALVASQGDRAVSALFSSVYLPISSWLLTAEWRKTAYWFVIVWYFIPEGLLALAGGFGLRMLARSSKDALFASIIFSWLMITLEFGWWFFHALWFGLESPFMPNPFFEHPLLFAKLYLADCILALASAGVGLIVGDRVRAAKDARRRQGLCMVCEYDLRGSIQTERCPECGTPFNPSTHGAKRGDSYCGGI